MRKSGRTQSEPDGPTPDGEKPPRKSAERRAAIVEALKRCVLEKGYAETSLSDLARSVGMSVSHLLYYYSTKDLILLDLYEEIEPRMLGELTSGREEPVDERIHSFVDNVFPRNAIGRAEIRVAFEFMTLATQQPELKSKLNPAVIADYLADLFSKAPRRPGLSAEEAAQITSALWVGLFTNINYDKPLEENAARRVFRKTLFLLANLEGESSRADGPTASTTAPSKATKPKRSTRKVRTAQ